MAKLAWERKDAMISQKRAEEAQARSKRKKAADPRAIMISSYKTSNDDSIFAYLSPIVEDLTILCHEKSDLEKPHGFLDPNLGVNDQVFPEIYSLKD
ncbi:hypothetical protein H5410_030556, partial [Solanum commersonii]